jgi:hypothetical protein
MSIGAKARSPTAAAAAATTAAATNTPPGQAAASNLGLDRVPVRHYVGRVVARRGCRLPPPFHFPQASDWWTLAARLGLGGGGGGGVRGAGCGVCGTAGGVRGRRFADALQSIFSDADVQPLIFFPSAADARVSVNLRVCVRVQDLLYGARPVVQRRRDDRVLVPRIVPRVRGCADERATLVRARSVFFLLVLWRRLLAVRTDRSAPRRARCRRPSTSCRGTSTFVSGTVRSTRSWYRARETRARADASFAQPTYFEACVCVCVCVCARARSGRARATSC